MAGVGGGMMSRLRRFDAYPKTLDDFRIKTFSGAAVSIVSGLLMLLLFASELQYFLSAEVTQELFVDTTRGEKMRINIDIVFPRMACAYLSIDVMDISGEQQLDVEHNLYKKRLDENGNPVREPEEKHNELGTANATDLKAALNPDRCESCYGAETAERPCCNTCEAVREAYRIKGWAFNSGQGIQQCEREGWSDKIAAQANEGCAMYGYLLVNKVAGNFHFAPGKSFQQHNIHIHDLQQFGRQAVSFNMSHQIRRLSFGTDYPGLVNPLDNKIEIATNAGSAMFQYFIKVVPTRYHKITTSSSKLVSTNQYSATQHVRYINHARGENGLPGVFFMFEINPIMVQLTESRRSFLHFLTGVCAIVGGIFTVAGMVDSVIYHGYRTYKKQQMGKLG